MSQSWFLNIINLSFLRVRVMFFVRLHMSVWFCVSVYHCVSFWVFICHYVFVRVFVCVLICVIGCVIVYVLYVIVCILVWVLNTVCTSLWVRIQGWSGVVRSPGRQMQVSEFFEPIGMFHRNFPWAHHSNSRENLWYKLALQELAGIQNPTRFPNDSTESQCWDGQSRKNHRKSLG